MNERRRRSPLAWSRAALSALTVASALLGADVQAGPGSDADQASDLITGLEFDEARRLLAGLDARDPRVAFEKARLALYEEDCDGAVAILARPDVAASEAGATLGDVARGCARVTAGTLRLRDDAHGVEVRYQDEGDQALQPYLVETVERARAVLTADLGVRWPKPTRIVVVRDLMSLSAMTGLPREAAQTTGTVAVAKWGRVTLLSPRATRHGYSWRDTLNHELAHLAVTRQTLDHAPLWLQEGVAKREEVRWRPPSPFDDRPSAEAVVARGMQLKLDLPLDKLGPSIAMLPSADAAMVAFAEVTSFVRFYATDAGEGALPKLLAALRTTPDPNAALRVASGKDLAAWDLKWRAHLTETKREPLPASFGLGPATGIARGVRERVRLAELLLGRQHGRAALGELDRLRAPELGDDASLRHLRARALEASPPTGALPSSERIAQIEAVLGEPKDVGSSYGPWWALRGRVARLRGDSGAAEAFFLEALAEDPLDEEVACQTLPSEEGPPAVGQAPPGDPASRPPAAAAVAPGPTKALCDAARARGVAPIGHD